MTVLPLSHSAKRNDKVSEENILTGILPNYIVIGKEKYKINTDFKIWIKFEELLLGGGNASEIFTEAIVLCMDKRVKTPSLPPSFKETIEGLCDFYFCRDKSNVKECSSSRTPKRLYSFSEDAELIYAAFLQEYGIDLSESEMHWWKFRALFTSLSGKSKFCSVMKIRAADLSDIKDVKAKNNLSRLKSIYALKDLRSESERDSELAEALW